ncbi:MAG: amidoligase family protein [Bacteroidetes bacterium]|nr:amidoligase family protein [Bacteroidota bacterium]
MTQQEILRTNQTKTWKIERLLELGKTRQEVADLVETNYGFAHNVYARLFPDRIRRNSTREVLQQTEYMLRNFEFNHTFGVEIEAYGIRKEEVEEELRAAGIETRNESYNHTTRNHWKIVSDGSLTGQNTFELVSPKLRGKAGLRQLKTVCLILKGMETKVNKSCGLHIHFDAAEFDIKTWKRLYKNYAKLELHIDSFMAPSRRGSINQFCKSLRVANFENKIDDVSNLEYMETGLRMIETKITGGNRYFKLNSQSYWRHKSVEFRQHAGTVQFEKIQNWIYFLARLIEYSKNAEVRNETWETLKSFLSEDLMSYFAGRKRELARQ